jgi:predicted transcriptional regulator YdeE
MWGDVSVTDNAWTAIFNVRLPKSGQAVSDGLELELHGEDFDRQRDTATIEIWVPLKT